MKDAKPLATMLVAFVVAAVLVTGCASGAATAPAASTPSNPSGAIALKVGLITPLSGDVKTFGESVKNAYDLAADVANKSGKVQITTVVGDSKADATEGVNAAIKLINQDRVNAIVGPVVSRVAIATSETINASKILMITPTGTNPKVTVDNGKRKDYVFRACFIDPFQGQVMSKFALNTLKAKTGAVVYDQSNDYSKGLAENFKTAFEQAGGKVVTYVAYGKDDVDFSAILTKVASDNADVLFIPDYYNKVNLISKQAREKGVKSVFLGVDGWDSSELDTGAVDGGYFSNHYSADDLRPEVQDWIKMYQAKYGSAPDALGTLSYDATNLLVAAAVKAGSNDPTKLRDAMASISGFKGVTGSISFDKDGNPIKPAVVLQVKGGKTKYVETVNP
jgi:branched-chain amino acid transport system substrate-binding protein